MQSPIDSTDLKQRAAIRIVLALALFGAGYLLLNYQLILNRIVYAYAAGRTAVAAWSLIQLSAQAFLLFLLISISKRWIFGVAMVVIAISGLTNLIYENILKVPVDAASVEWLMAEARQAGSAAEAFLPAIGLAAAKLALISLLWWLARRIAFSISRSEVGVVPLYKSRLVSVTAVAILTAVSMLPPSAGVIRGAELNVYSFAAHALSQTHLQRAAVKLSPSASSVEKIIWLVDESVAFKHFEAVMQPDLTEQFGAIDYGDTVSFANCSSQSNANLRWGVSVDAANPAMDLRASPSIWSYARKAGFETTLIDGQVKGQPQNYLWEPEKKLIDHIVSAGGGIDTDRHIAEMLNEQMKNDKKQFFYVVLRGAHYAYESNYPKDDLSLDAPLIERYRHAITYSKAGFFGALLKGLDRSKLAVVYTSDHGQIVKEGVKPPHCHTAASAEEFAVPLLVFAPPALETKLRPVTNSDTASKHSHSQIFPTTLIWMGYDAGLTATQFDQALPLAPRRYVTFGKRIWRQDDGNPAEVFLNREYPRAE